MTSWSRFVTSAARECGVSSSRRLRHKCDALAMEADVISGILLRPSAVASQDSPDSIGQSSTKATTKGGA